jgi:hypothetical protein
MEPIEPFNQVLTSRERRTVAGLRTPTDIQAFLDRLRFRSASIYCAPLRVLRERTAHCFDGALFAAASLRRLGHPPLIVELVPNRRDDGHVLAVFKHGGHWGAIAKSNYVGLRFREPVYRTLRELAMSYFEPFYNVKRERTLRAYTLPLNLSRFDATAWMTSDEAAREIAEQLDLARRVPLLKAPMVRRLSPVDDRSFRAGLLEADPAGLHTPA